MKVYIEQQRKLAFLDQKATPAFWDQHWKTDLLRRLITSCTNDSLFVPAVKKWLPDGGTILEGGCGRGHLVHAFRQHGYLSIGMDFAINTINAIHTAVPELTVLAGDVRAIPLKNESIDGYVSVGVIEHFLEGYGEILDEMSRVIKKGGYLFISFPYLSPIRKFKASVGGYRESSLDEIESKQDQFYQFALDKNEVTDFLAKSGFILKDSRPYDGIKGFKDELTWFKPILQPIYDGKLPARVKRYLDFLLKPFSSHCVLLTLQKSRTI